MQPGKQLSFRAPKREKRTPRSLHAFDSLNRMASEIILADKLRYAGLPVMWAEMWQAGHPGRWQNTTAVAADTGTKQA